MTIISRLKRIVRNPLVIFNLLGKKGFINWLPDSLYLKILYFTRMNTRLNLKKPLNFNEKLQWLKLYDRQDIYTVMADKYLVRDLIRKEIGEDILIPILGVWDNFDAIDFNQLPNQFVLKCTHDSGGVVICEDKTKFDIELAKKKINKSLSRNYYYYTREWPYKNIKPRIICEEYMIDEIYGELKDYKLMCFNGKVEHIFVCLNRNSSTGLNIDIYDKGWRLLPFERPTTPNSIEKNNKKPVNFEKMINYAEKLSKGIPFLRVDFYEINDRLFFGELTFYPGSGFEKFRPNNYDRVLGDLLHLPKEK